MDYSIDSDAAKRAQRFAEFCDETIAPHAAEMEDPSRREARLQKNYIALSDEKYFDLLLSHCESDWWLRAQAECSLARACASTFWSLQSSLTLFGGALSQLGGGEHARLKSLAAGKTFAAYCWSDAAKNNSADSVSLEVQRRGNGFVLKGERALITNAPIASVAVVVAAEPGSSAKRAFCVDLNAKGVRRGETLKTLGVRGAPIGTLYFDDVALESSSLLGAEEETLSSLGEVIKRGRISTAMMAIGIAQAAYVSASKHVKKREVGGRSIAKKQAVHFKIADMVVDIESARLIALKAAWTHRSKATTVKDVDSLANIAKVHSTEMALRVTNAALQIHGGWGYVEGSDVERYYRDARMGPLALGTSEIQRDEIATNLLKSISSS